MKRCSGLVVYTKLDGFFVVGRDAFGLYRDRAVLSASLVLQNASAIMAAAWVVSLRMVRLRFLARQPNREPQVLNIRGS